MLRQCDIIKAYKLNGFELIKTSDDNIDALYRDDGKEYYMTLLVNDVNREIVISHNVNTFISNFIYNNQHLPLGAKINYLVIVFTDKKCISKNLYETNNLVVIDVLKQRMRYCSVNQSFLTEKKIIKQCQTIETARENRKESIINISSYPYVSYIIIAFLVFAYLRNLFPEEKYGISPDTVLRDKEYYRLLTYQFAHTNIFHLLGNSISIICIGRAFEKRIGNLRYLFIYLFGGIYAGLASVHFHNYIGTSTDVLTIGASGAIFATLGGLLTVTIMLENLGNKNHFAFIFYCICALLYSFFYINVDSIAHVGGFLSGIVLTVIFVLFAESYHNYKYAKHTQYIYNHK